MPSKSKDTDKSDKSKKTDKTIKLESKKDDKVDTKSKNHKETDTKSKDHKETETKSKNHKETDTKSKDHKETETKSKSKDTKSEKETKSFDKSDKSDKSDKEVETKSKSNQLTLKSGCHFNVNKTKNWIKNFYSRPNYQIVSKKKTNKSEEDDDDDDDKKEKHMGCFKSGYCVLTGINEVIMNNLINQAAKKAKKDVKTGLLKITEENMIDVIRLDKELNKALGHFIDEYNSSNTYQKELDISKAELNSFVENKCMNGNSTLFLDVNAANFLMFIVRTVDSLLCECSFQMSSCYFKSNINSDNIIHSLKVIFPVGQMQKSMLLKADDVSNRVKDDKNKKSLSDNSDDSNDSNNKKSSKSKSKKDDDDDDDNNDDNDDDDDDDDDENEENEEDNNDEDEEDEEDEDEDEDEDD